MLITNYIRAENNFEDLNEEWGCVDGDEKT